MTAPKTRQPYSQDVTKFAVDVFLITPNDSADLPHVTRAISVAVAGALEIVTVDGSTVIIPSGALAAGVMHPIGASRIKAANTTATGIVGYV